MFDNHKAASINRSIRYWLKERSRIETELSVTSSDDRLKSKIQELQEEIKKMDDDE